MPSECRNHVGWPQSFGAPHQQAEARMVHKRVELPLQSKIYNRRQTRDVPPSPTPGQWCAVTEAYRPALTLWVGLENKLFKQQVPNRPLKPFEHERTMFPSFNTHCKRMLHHCSTENTKRSLPNDIATPVADDTAKNSCVVSCVLDVRACLDKLFHKILNYNSHHVYIYIYIFFLYLISWDEANLRTYSQIISGCAI